MNLTKQMEFQFLMKSIFLLWRSLHHRMPWGAGRFRRQASTKHRGRDQDRGQHMKHRKTKLTYFVTFPLQSRRHPHGRTEFTTILKSLHRLKGLTTQGKHLPPQLRERLMNARPHRLRRKVSGAWWSNPPGVIRSMRFLQKQSPGSRATSTGGAIHQKVRVARCS